jgi:glutamate N-acetyltransferase / amino-acid N-acetyltransferase
VRVALQSHQGRRHRARGFRAAAISCGIKNPEATRLDLALIVSDFPTVPTPCSPRTRCVPPASASPQQHIRESDTRAIIANSGNANACTGPQGIQDAKAHVQGGRRGPGHPHAPGPRLLHRHHRHAHAHQRITPASPNSPKSSARRAPTTPRGHHDQRYPNQKSTPSRCPAADGSFRIGGIAKGAGMICPNMATMLCFITTDAKIGRR